MKSSYRRIGDFIRLVDERNSDLSITTLLGLSISKEFIPSVANIVGSDMGNYKIIRKNQFACSLMQVRRDKKLPVALLKEFDEAIISQAYPVFEITNTQELSPDYLMMWMSRSEFDRHACFLAVGGVRGSLEWDDFCDMTLPVPPIEKQRQIVREYNTIINRIKLNEQLCQKLEETAQALYKQWFVDFEFPISAEYAAALGQPELESRPYKSSGGEMVYCEELEQEIPQHWSGGSLSNMVNTQYGFTTSAETTKVGPKFLRITDIAKPLIEWDSVPYCKIPRNELKKYEIFAGDILVARTGATVGYAKRINKRHPNSIFASYLVRITPKEEIKSYYLALTVTSEQYKEFIQNVAGGSGQPQASATLMTEYKLIDPISDLLESFNIYVEKIFDLAELFQQQNCSLRIMKDFLLSSLVTKSREFH